MPLTSIHPTQLAFVNAVKPWAISGSGARTVGDFEDWFVATYPATTLVFKDWKGDTVADPDPAWYISCSKYLWAFSPPFDCVTEYPPDSFTITINERPVHCQSGGPGGPLVPCPDASCVYTLSWTYEAGTLYSTAGSWAWGVALDSPLYNAGWSGSHFAYLNTPYDWIGDTANNHLPVDAGQLVTLDVLFNNRSSSATSAYRIAWYDHAAAVTPFSEVDLLVCGGHGNSWMAYSDSATAPAGAVGFAVRMPRQSGQDDVTLCVADPA